MLFRLLFLVLFAGFLAACGGGSDPAVPADAATPPAASGPVAVTPAPTPTNPPGTTPPTELDQTLRGVIAFKGLTGNPMSGRTLPAVGNPLVGLGKQLFFTKSLSGNLDTACASCHHPLLGGGDGLSLPVGTGATDANVLGPGRTHVSGVPRIGRNAQSILNVGLKDTAMLWDGRVQSLAPVPVGNGAGSPIRTPESAFGTPDPDAGDNLTVAQSRFPVTMTDEMRGTEFVAGGSANDVRDHIAARLGNYGVGAGELAVNDWLPLFQAAFGSTASAAELITFSNIARAIGEYQRSLVFVNSPWAAYVAGDNAALGDVAKRGALAFFATPIQGGGGCVLCHIGDQFTDQREHVVATPAFGPGKGDGSRGTEDFGRGRVSGEARDLYRFRTPGLLNVEVTGPWMHNGAYGTLEDVVRHYSDTVATATAYPQSTRWCELPQFASIAGCAALFPNASTDTQAVLDQLAQLRLASDSLLPALTLTEVKVTEIAEFLRSLTDPCVKSRDCLAPWLPTPGVASPDGQQLEARAADGSPL